MTLTIPHPRTGHRFTIVAMAVAVAVVAGIALGAYQLTDTFDGGGPTRPTPAVDIAPAGPNQGPNQGLAPELTSRPTQSAVVSSTGPNQGPNQGIAPELTSQ